MIFKSKDRGGQYLRLAADLTGSGGWRQDAVAYAAYESEADVAEGKIRAVFVLQNLDALGADLHLAMAPGRRMTRMVLEDLARFLFGSAWARLPMIRAYIPAQNTDAQLVALHLGFQFVARIPAGIAGSSDAILMTITPDQLRLPLPVKRVPPAV